MWKFRTHHYWLPCENEAWYHMLSNFQFPMSFRAMGWSIIFSAPKMIWDRFRDAPLKILVSDIPHGPPYCQYPCFQPMLMAKGCHHSLVITILPPLVSEIMLVQRLRGGENQTCIAKSQWSKACFTESILFIPHMGQVILIELILLWSKYLIEIAFLKHFQPKSRIL